MRTGPRLPLGRAIYEAWDASQDERARYWLDLYKQASDGSVERGRYCDIGSGTGELAMRFGSAFAHICCVDRVLVAKDEVKPFLILGDAGCLPFRTGAFDVVSMFALIEHVEDPQTAFKEAARVLKANGELVIYWPNRYFPIDSHTGLINPLLVPSFLRLRYLRTLGYPSLEPANCLSVRTVNWLLADAGFTSITLRKVAYPTRVIPRGFRTIYTVARKLGLLRLVPLGYFAVARLAAQIDQGKG